ncbi:uncharacterized protein LOC107036774 [Diachasma alloeum]|uniref:uncharacterized protein LOC107036774 n=1 Tax=Diachasma alloeum TaxID=454923 RepID=UPI00073841F7|nr:uncharacterized protein LOC107036774 [Diachasma alloeum]
MNIRCCLRPMLHQFDRAFPIITHRAELATALKQEVIKKKKKKGIWPWSKEPEDEKIKILRPGECEEKETFLDPKCKVAIIVNGGKSFGLSAAHSLLHHGAKNVIVADDSPSAGQKAAQHLCDMHGRDRAHFALCALNSICKFEAVFDSVLCRQRNIHILFNNLDGTTTPSQLCGENDGDDADWSKTRRAIEVGVKFMGKQNGGAGGIIINTARILGFMGWPEEPVPVYCTKEPVVETTQDLAKMYAFEKTGVRIITLLEASRPFEEIGLPDFPAAGTKPERGKPVYTACASAMESKIGRAIVHLMAKAENGSTWLMESASPRELPRLIHFPSKEGEKIDPKIYDEVPCPPAFESFCASTKDSTCSPDIKTHCTP